MTARHTSLLLVEDDDLTREVLTLRMTAAGWSVHTAATGEAALAVLGANTAIGTVLCDVNLPGLRGPELAAAIQTFAPGLTLLAMSATPFTAPPHGFHAMLLKPFGPPELDGALDQLRSATIPAHRNTPEEVPPKPAPDELTILRPATVLQLQAQMGSRARELYAFALADAGDRLTRLTDAAAHHDTARWRSEAHALKGSAGMIGAERLSRLAGAAEAIETAVPADTQQEPFRSSVEAMRLACDEIRLMLETLFTV